MIFLYCSSLPDDFNAVQAEQDLKGFFSGNESREFIKQIVSRKDSAESLFAYSLLMRIIDDRATELNYSGEPLILSRGSSGKPFFSDSHIKFNISHSKGYVTCAVSDGAEIGVDIEASSPPPEKAIALTKRFLDKKALKFVEADPKIFARLWTEKEAAIKFFGINFADSDKILPEAAPTYHFFSYRNIPITLCTERNFHKIIFCGDRL